MTKTKLISDEQSLNGATTRYGYSIPVYDDGFGDLYIHRNSIGISGIVRARSWEDAYSIYEDEFADEVTETWEELEKEFSTVYMSGRELWMHEHKETFGDSTFEAWKLLSESDKQQAYRQGRDVPFTGDITEHPCFQEQYGFRSNTGDKGILYAKDLNGDSLDKLTPKLLAELEITLDIKTND